MLLAAEPSPILLPPADPAHTPLPAGLRLTIDPLPRPPRLGEAVLLTLRITAGAQPADLLWDGDRTQLQRRLTAPDGRVRDENPVSEHRYGYGGVTRLPPGGSVHATVLARIGSLPSGPGKHRFSVFADLGWGAERPADPRRATIDIDWAQPQPGEVPAIIAIQFAAKEDTYEADSSSLSHPVFAAELARLARAGSYRALRLLGETPGPDAARALIELAEHPPERWTDLRTSETPNLAFCLFSRLADHLPPRRLPTEEAWWELPAAIYRRETMAGVPTTLLPAARSAALPWIGRADWGVAEVLTWSALPEDRPLLMATISTLSRLDPQPINHLHTLWQYAYAALLAAPEAPPPDPEAGVAEALLWACHRCNVSRPWSASDDQRFSALLASRDPLRQRIGLWGLPSPLPASMIPLVVTLMRPGTGQPRDVLRDALSTARSTPDPRIWDAMLEVARDPVQHEDYTIVPVLLAAGRRVELAQAVTARCRADGSRGDDSFRAFCTACLGVRPIFMYGQQHPTLPSIEAWSAAAEQWRTWITLHGPAIAAEGPLLPGDPRQPDYLLWPTWWFEAADCRRFFAPGPGM